MAKCRKYHSNVWFPDDHESKIGQFFAQLPSLKLSDHAAIEFNSDQYGPVPVPTVMDLQSSNVLEMHELLTKVGKPSGYIDRVVFRVGHLNAFLDYTYVLSSDGTVVTGWANTKNDNHALTYSRYFMPKEMHNGCNRQISA